MGGAKRIVAAACTLLVALTASARADGPPGARARPRGGDLAYATDAAGSSRIKDLVDIEGVRQNQLIGYGLVVGLNGTGDSLNNSPFTLR